MRATLTDTTTYRIFLVRVLARSAFYYEAKWTLFHEGFLMNMKTMCLLILATGLRVASDGPGKDDPSKGDLDELRGTWLTVSLVNDGKTLVDEKVPPKEGPTTKLVYNGNKWMVKAGDKTVAAGTIKIDSTKTPKEIDV